MVLTKSLSEDFSPEPGGRRYMVLPGDTLLRILRKFGVEEGLSPSYRARFLAGNPQVRDPDLIRPGQVLVIPLPGTTGAPVPGRGAAVDTPPLVVTTPAEARETLPAVDPSALVTQALTGLGEEVRDRGTLFFPVKGQGTLSLDASRFPLAPLSTGAVLLVDREGTVPGPVKGLVESAWPGYRVVSLAGATPEEALDRVLTAGGYHAVSRGKNVVLGDGEIQVSLKSDWLVEKTADSIVDGELYALTYARTRREEIPPALRDYAARHGIEVVVLPGYQGAPSRESPAAPGAPELLPGADTRALTDRVLERLGFPAERDCDLKLFGGEDVGLSLSFRADRLVEAVGRRVVVSFRPVDDSLATAVSELGYTPLALPEGTPPREAVRSLLAALGLRFFSPDVEFFAPGREGRETYLVSVPGIFARHRGESLLFTGREPDRSILAFLAGRGIKVLVYGGEPPP